MPKDQAYIKQVFRNKGIKEEPTYQRYTEESVSYTHLDVYKRQYICSISNLFSNDNND